MNKPTVWASVTLHLKDVILEFLPVCLFNPLLCRNDWCGSKGDRQSNSLMNMTTSRSCWEYPYSSGGAAARIISTAVVIGKKKNMQSCFATVFFSHCLPFPPEALLVCETHHSIVLAFYFFYFNLLFHFSCPLCPTFFPPLFLLYCSAITIYDKDLSPSFSPVLCPPFPSMSWRFNGTSSCCCSVSRECPYALLGLGDGLPS